MKTISHIILREWKRIFTIPAFYVVLIIIPPLLYFFYGFIYQKQFARELPVGLWDEDQSAITRQLSDMMNASPSIHFNDNIHSEAELKKNIFSGKIYGAVHFPKNFEADIKKGKTVNISLYTNAAALVGAKMIYKDAAGVAIKGGLAVVLQKQMKQGMPKGQAAALIQPIKLNTFTLYNPDYNYKEFLTPGLITVGIQMAIIMISVLLLNYEKKTDTENQLIQLSKASASNIVIGKSLAHLSISWYIFAFVFFLVFPFFELSKPGNILNIFILYNFLILACIAIGAMVSALLDDTMMATDIALFFTSPAFVFSGFTFPRWAMPWYDQYYAAIMPYTYFMDGFVKAYFMGLPLKYLQSEIISLSLFIIICFSLAILIYQYKINKKTMYAA